MYGAVAGKSMLTQERFEEFASLISIIHGSIQKLKARYTAQFGLKPVHVFWLYLLMAHPEGMSASQLAAAGGINRSLVSRELDGLLDRGLIVAQEHGPKRRYGSKLTLTDRGREMADIISAVASSVQDSVSREIPKEDLSVFYRTLTALADEFRALEKNSRIQEVIDQCL